MIVGQTVFYQDGNSLYTPEFPRGGLAAIFPFDVTHLLLGGASQFDITIEHRNREDVAFGTATSISVSSTGDYSAEGTALKEILRISFGFSGGSPVVIDAAHVLVQAPSWRPYS